MKILVDHLTATPKAYVFEGDQAWWRESGLARGEYEAAWLEPVRFELGAHRMGEDLYIEGVARADFQLGCSRCLARYRHPLREPFRIVLEPAGDRVPAEPEAAAALTRYGTCLADELEAGWYSGNRIDLSGYLQEVVALALPVQPLCREDCRGLCPRCGVDRNVGTCSCRATSSSSPFAVLGALRAGRGDG